MTINLHLRIKAVIIYMASEPEKKIQELTYTRLCFLPKLKELNNTNREQDVQLGVTQELDRRGNNNGREEVNSC